MTVTIAKRVTRPPRRGPPGSPGGPLPGQTLHRRPGIRREAIPEIRLPLEAKQRRGQSARVADRHPHGRVAERLVEYGQVRHDGRGAVCGRLQRREAEALLARHARHGERSRVERVELLVGDVAEEGRPRALQLAAEWPVAREHELRAKPLGARTAVSGHDRAGELARLERPDGEEVAVREVPRSPRDPAAGPSGARQHRSRAGGSRSQARIAASRVASDTHRTSAAPRASRAGRASRCHSRS